MIKVTDYRCVSDQSMRRLSVKDRVRLLLAGAQVSERIDGVCQYLLPNGKVFAREALDGDRIVLKEASAR